MKKAAINIVICDDHPLINEGLQRMVDSIDNMTVAGTAATITELLASLQKTKADIVLLDINLPDGNGIDMCAEIKKRYPRVKILVISSHGDRSSLIKMIRNGASGYLPKSASAGEIEHAINLIYQGESYYSKEMQHVIISVLSDTLQEERPPVTRREREILVFLKNGLNSQQIADKLCISQFTVETHRKNLMAKFNVSKTINLLEKARTLGLV